MLAWSMLKNLMVDSLLNALSNGELDVDEMKDTGEKSGKELRFCKTCEVFQRTS